MTANTRTLHWIAVADSQIDVVRAFAGSFDDVDLRTYESFHGIPAEAEPVALALAAGSGQVSAIASLLTSAAVSAVQVELPTADGERVEVADAIRRSGWAVASLSASGRGTWLAHLARPAPDVAVLPHMVSEAGPPVAALNEWPDLPRSQGPAKAKRPVRNASDRAVAKRRLRRRQWIFVLIALASVTVMVSGAAAVAGYTFAQYGTHSHTIIALVLTGVALQASTLVGVVYVARHARHTRLHRDHADMRVQRQMKELERSSLRTREELNRQFQAVQSSVLSVSRTVEAVAVQGSRALAQLQESTRTSQLVLSRQVQALGQLERLVPLSAPTPPMGGGAPSPDMVLLLVERLLADRPRVVVECGSGISTLYLAAAVAQRGLECRIVSLEHDSARADKTRDLLAAHGVGHVAEVRWAPLDELGLDEHEAPWYSAAALGDLSDIGLLFVDGPEAPGRQPRFPALPVLQERLAEHAVVIMGGLVRTEDAWTAQRWATLYPEFRFEVRTDLETHAGLLVRSV